MSLSSNGTKMQHGTSSQFQKTFISTTNHFKTSKYNTVELLSKTINLGR